MKWFNFSFPKIAIVQFIAVVLIIINLTVFKFFLKKQYKEILKFYNKEILSETDVQDVLREEKYNGI